MTLHLIKLCVGVSEIEEMQSWVKLARGAKEELDHVTRMFPRRTDEVLDGGSLYWVIRGLILCRQPIADLQEVVGADGIQRCRIVFEPKIILVRPTPRRAFQGWRYLLAEDAPADLPRGEKPGDMSDSMRRELAALGLL
ncbi:MAG: DUF1489 domain-containing protein [Alphaproteobacteria bacterium]|nr:DUF1489 domain-containing protein [Alphaproteobacteria bacterium]